MDKHDIPILGDFYTKKEVDDMIAAAVAESNPPESKAIVLQ